MECFYFYRRDLFTKFNNMANRKIFAVFLFICFVGELITLTEARESDESNLLRRLLLKMGSNNM